MKIPATPPALLVYDFDGVMTDNRVIVREDGMESVICSRADGMGINQIKAMELPQIILSTEINPVVATRAKKIGIPAIHGSKDKKQTLKEYCAENNIALEHVWFTGNDTNDYEVMMVCGCKLCPSDAHQSIKDIADITMQTKGGYGVIRELADILQKHYS